MTIIPRNKIFNIIEKHIPANLVPKKKELLRKMFPDGVFSSEGRIYAQFLLGITEKIVEAIPEIKKSAHELLVEFKREDVVVIAEQLTSVYHALLREKEHLAQQAIIFNALRRLDFNQNNNRVVFAESLAKIIGNSGIRFYLLNLNSEKPTWHHQFSNGEEGLSSFETPAIPPSKSEKAKINALLKGEVPEREIREAAQKGLWSWVVDKLGGYSYLHIPDRNRCVFTDKEQLKRDETGSENQNRQGYGVGNTREIFYVVFSVPSKGLKELEVCMVTNWAKNREAGQPVPLFSEMEKELGLLGALSAHFAVARSNAIKFLEMEDASIIDPLTGIHNRRYYNEQIKIEFDKAKRKERDLSFIMFDIDHFKNINDTYGHPAGDFILREVAQIIKKNLRSSDIVARYGGEEFAAVVPETGLGMDIQLYAERIRKKIEGSVFTYEGDQIKLTISMGISSFPGIVETLPELTASADQALYKAKSTGRNRWVIAEKPDDGRPEKT